MKFQKNDIIITAFAEDCSGPGWSNQIIWVIVSNKGELRTECIHPDERNERMAWLFDCSQVSHISMKNAVESWIRCKRDVITDTKTT